jgi:hypothetical protein
MAGLGSKVGALVLCAGLGAIMVPACVIHIGPGMGEDEQTPSDPSVGAGGTGGQAGVGGGALSPEEQAALDALEALQEADPETFAIKSGATAYAAVATASLVESQIADPTSVDPAAVSHIFEQYAPIAVDQALLWMQSVDLSALPRGVIAQYECTLEPHYCSSSEHCLNWDPPGRCVVTQCGKGSCPWCPFWNNLVYEAWCGYACMQSGQWVGGAVKLRTYFGEKWDGPHCFRF